MREGVGRRVVSLRGKGGGTVSPPQNRPGEPWGRKLSGDSCDKRRQPGAGPSGGDGPQAHGSQSTGSIRLQNLWGTGRRRVRTTAYGDFAKRKRRAAARLV